MSRKRIQVASLGHEVEREHGDRQRRRGGEDHGYSEIALMFAASWSIAPQLGSDGSNPSPMNDSVDSASTKAGTSSSAWPARMPRACRNQVPDQDADVRGTRGSRRLDVAPSALADDDGACRPGHLGCARHGEDRHHRDEEHGRRECERKSRPQREHDVDDRKHHDELAGSHEPRIERPTGVAGHAANGEPHEQRQRARGQRQAQRQARPEHQAGPHVAPERVRPKRKPLAARASASNNEKGFAVSGS